MDERLLYLDPPDQEEIERAAEATNRLLLEVECKACGDTGVNSRGRPCVPCTRNQLEKGRK